MSRVSRDGLRPSSQENQAMTTEPLDRPDDVCTCGHPKGEHIGDGQCTVLTESHPVNPSMTVSAVCPCLSFTLQP